MSNPTIMMMGTKEDNARVLQEMVRAISGGVIGALAAMTRAKFCHVNEAKGSVVVGTLVGTAMDEVSRQMGELPLHKQPGGAEAVANMRRIALDLIVAARNTGEFGDVRWIVNPS